MRPPDYGNARCTALLTCVALSYPNVREQLQWIVEYVPSINPGCKSEYGLTMKGDVAEILVAALRGHKLYDIACTAADVRFDATTLKQVCCWLEHVCKLIQYLDAILRTSEICWKKLKRPLLHNHEEFEQHDFVQCWQHIYLRGICLYELIESGKH